MKCCVPRYWVVWIVIALVCSWRVPMANAQIHEAHETPEKSWKDADHDCSLRVLQHVRTFEQARSGQASEFVQFQAGAGTYFHLTHEIPPSRIIEELNLSVWVKSNRAGQQLAARVVLPRSKHPRTGLPLSMLIRGTSYSEVGTWQKLAIEQPNVLVARQIPMLRSQLEGDISDREAYVDLVVLNAYGGAGTTDLWIDDLELNGHVSTGISVPPAGGSAVQFAADGLPAAAVGSGPRTGLVGSVLLVEGRPQLVRAVEHNGEPFTWLKSLGFNTLSLRAPPTPAQLREAEEAGMWLITPPPLGTSPLDYGAGLARIVAWHLGDSLAKEFTEPTRRLALQLKSVPDEARRPTLCLPREDVWEFSRIADLLLFEPPVPNGSLPLRDVGTWYLQRARLMRAGTHYWAAIRTQVHPTVMDQVHGLTGWAGMPWSLEPEQVRLLAYHALASGARGLIFRSHSRLDATDRQSLLRAKTLQWLNLELLWLEPWAATGQHDAELDTGHPGVRASVLKTDRSRLLLVLRHQGDEQYIAGLPQDRTVTLDIPGVPETDEAYHVREDRLQRISRERSAGMRITLDHTQAVSAVVLTQDRLVINFLARQLNAAQRERDGLVREIASQLYALVIETHQQLLATTPASRLTSHTLDDRSLAQARTELQHFEQLVESGGHERSYEFLQRGLQQLAAARYHHWKLAVDSFPAPVASPLCVNFFGLPYHQLLSQRLQTAVWGPNALAGGDFENLQLLQSTGWRNLVGHQSELATAVELSLHHPRSGRAALRLQCWPTSGDQAPLAVESAPLSIVSAPVPVRAGQIVRIHGWARVPQPIQGSLDGLLIFDSAAGPELAQRVPSTPDWQEFTLYRAASRDGPLTITFALTGWGHAWLDDVTVHVLEPASQQAQTSPSTAR